MAEAQRFALPRSRLRAGAAGLSRRVSWATALRSRPPAFEPRGGGELVLASQDTLAGLAQIDHTLTLSRILEGLAQAGAAALAVAGRVPADAVRKADELGLPLIELAEEISLLDVERGIIRLVLDRYNALQSRATDLYRHLAQLLHDDRGLDEIIREAAAATGRLIAFEDSQFRLKAVAAPPEMALPPLDGAGLSSVEERSRLSAMVRHQPLSGATPPTVLLPAARWRLERAVAPVLTRERLRGFISICGEAQAVTEFDQLAAGRLAAICALELAKEDAVLAAEQRVQGDLVQYLLRPDGDVESAGRYAAQAGLAPESTLAVYVLELAPDAARGSAQAAVEAMNRYFRRAAVPAVTRLDAAEITVICEVARGAAAGAEARLRSLGEQVVATISHEAGHAVAAGASRPHQSVAALPQAAREAREALRIGRRVYGPGRLVAYDDLGLYRILYALRDTPELSAFFEQTLGPLVEYDRRTGLNLVETLEVFFTCHGNLTQTAKRLGLHRNSLLYRIDRIREIGRLDLEDPETRLSLQVALKAGRLLGKPKPPAA